eukprot:335654-Chlamydomonas_euryale.AAC.4
MPPCRQQPRPVPPRLDQNARPTQRSLVRRRRCSTAALRAASAGASGRVSRASTAGWEGLFSSLELLNGPVVFRRPVEMAGAAEREGAPGADRGFAAWE